VQNGSVLATLFLCRAILWVSAAGGDTQLGPAAKQTALDEIAAPTG
jgi:hypothetical protein